MRAPAPRRLARPLAALAAAAVLLGPADPARAQGKSRTAARTTSLDRRAARALGEKIAGNDPNEIGQALAAVQAAGPAANALAPAIEALLQRGTSVALGKAAIEALGAIGASSSSGAIRPYMRHRVPDLRRAAARALASTRGPEAIAALREGLRGGDAIVRGLSAAGLGRLGATDALPDLFAALDQNAPEAAASIGQICAGEACDRLVQRLGKLGFDVARGGLEAMLFRSDPLPDDALVKLVEAVRDLGSPEARAYLTDVHGRWPAVGSKRVKQAIERAIAQPSAGGP
jgi:hypothetical protein